MNEENTELDLLKSKHLCYTICFLWKEYFDGKIEYNKLACYLNGAIDASIDILALDPRSDLFNELCDISETLNMRIMHEKKFFTLKHEIKK